MPVKAAAFVQGRSSIGRAGLTVQNAGFVDPGFSGHITLELKNDSPCIIVLFPGYPVTQLVYMDAEDVSRPYTGKYNGQVEATGSRMQLDGLTPENVAEAIGALHPWGVDLSSGIETDRVKDSRKMAATVAAVRSAS